MTSDSVDATPAAAYNTFSAIWSPLSTTQEASSPTKSDIFLLERNHWKGIVEETPLETIRPVQNLEKFVEQETKVYQVVEAMEKPLSRDSNKENQSRASSRTESDPKMAAAEFEKVSS